MWFFHGFWWIPAYWLISKGNYPPADPVMNAKVNAQIEAVKNQMSAIEAKISTLRNQQERVGGGGHRRP